MSELKLEPIIADDVVWGKAYYEMHEVDDVIANLKAENDLLRSTTHSERDEYIDMVNARDKEIAELKRKLEDAKATAYAESVDAGMRERKLKRALYKACANWMINRQCAMSCFHLEVRAKKFDKAIDKCRAKAEEYK